MSHAQFLKAIAANKDASSRLVYADWLEEQGDQRAILLRLVEEDKLNDALELLGISKYDLKTAKLEAKQWPLYAADVAESVLHIFEERHPNDDRPRKAILAAREGTNKDAAASAADDAVWGAAWDNGDAYSGGSTYHAAKAAFHAAAHGVGDQAADAGDAAWDAVDATNRQEQRRFNLQRLFEYKCFDGLRIWTYHLQPADGQHIQ